MELKLNEALERTSSLKLEAKIYTPTAGKQTTCYIWTCPILPVFRYSHSHYSKKKGTPTRRTGLLAQVNIQRRRWGRKRKGKSHYERAFRASNIHVNSGGIWWDPLAIIASCGALVRQWYCRICSKSKAWEHIFAGFGGRIAKRSIRSLTSFLSPPCRF